MVDTDEVHGPTYPVSELSRVRRMHERGSHARADVYAVLDAAPICHVGYIVEGRPYVTPTLHWRDGDRVYWHGSAASRFLRQASGAPVCLTVSLMDGYVLARSAFHHSVNYRSAMVFGSGRPIENPETKRDVLRDFVDGLFPGRWDTLRPMTDQELRATTVMGMDIEEASVKTRAGSPGDGDEVAFPVWAGVLPIRSALAAAQPAPDLLAGIALPAALEALIASGRLR